VVEMLMAEDDVVDNVVDGDGDVVEEYVEDNADDDDDDDVMLKCFLIVDDLQYDTRPRGTARD
jgi:hypothetical protein